MHMYVCAKLRVDNERSEWYGVNVRVHQGSVLGLLLLDVVLDELFKDIRDGISKEFLHAYD